MRISGIPIGSKKPLSSSNKHAGSSVPPVPPQTVSFIRN